jgi:hypothetical protein
MIKLFRTSKSLIFLVFLIPILTIVSYILYVQISTTKVEIFNIIKNHIIEEKIHIVKNYTNQLLHKSINIQKYFDVENDNLDQNEDMLRLIKSNRAEYLYILHKDDDGKFRYLIDTTEDEAMETLKLHEHHHGGDSIHRFTTTEELKANTIF